MAQLKDLIVTGASRFLNNIYGNLIGNASSADKVNHKFKIQSDDFSAIEFDGSADKTLTLNLSNFKMETGVRVIGVVDTRYTRLEDNVPNNIIIDGIGHAIFLTEKKCQSITTYTGTVGSDSVLYYKSPRIGDLVLQDDQEFLCVAVGNNNSTWRAMDSSGYWGTF